ncbi:hypothetical protein C7S20_18400 [Christiangramia fulva]|uniref:DoxX family protein n=2 Tax=Christiangramia fulva TaxID=2126553 RepID=A0A2R3Z9W9_9FLAO|nr:hypothetical protein C7S20_18400 [Christiangramia fulva]
MLFLSVFPFPIGYYTWLRLVITFSSGMLCFYHYKNDDYTMMSILGIVALLFNPVYPVYLGKKGIWLPIDLIVGCIFIYEAVKFPMEKK